MNSLSVVQRTTFRTTRFYMQNAVSTATFRRLMRGDINVAGISRALAGRVARRIAATCDPAVRLLQRQETPVGRIRRQMQDLADRSVQILFVLSGNDPGLDEMAEYFGAQGRQLRRLRNVSFHLLEGADHTLSMCWTRLALLQHVAVYMNRYFDVPMRMERGAALARRTDSANREAPVDAELAMHRGFSPEALGDRHRRFGTGLTVSRPSACGPPPRRSSPHPR